MPVFGLSKAQKWGVKLRQKLRDLIAPPKMRAMDAPGAKNIVAPARRFPKLRVIVRPIRRTRLLQKRRFRLAPGKNIAHPHRPIPQTPRAPLTALNRWIVRQLRGLRWVQHHKHQPPPVRVPNPAQGIAIPVTFRINGTAFGSTVRMDANNQAHSRKTRLGASSPER